MAQKVIIGGKQVSRPGVYTLVKSGINNTPAGLDYGHVVIVDDGIGAGFGGGAANTLYSFDNVDDYRAFVKGGVLWSLGEPLFKPFSTLPGASKVSIIHAREATPATITYSLTNGQLILTSIDTGVNANGVLTSGLLSAGYAAKIVSTAPVSAPTFIGSVKTTAGTNTAEVHQFVPSNVQQGAAYSIDFTESDLSQDVILSVTAPSASQLDLINAFIAAIAANSTLSPLFTGSIGSSNGQLVLLITSAHNNTAFTATASVTAATPQVKFQIYHSTYKGIDALNNVPFDGLTVPNSPATLIAESPAVGTLADALAWAQSDIRVTTGFTAAISGVTNGGTITSVDVTNNPGYQLATGAVEAYTSNAFTAAINVVQPLSNSFFLATSYGANAVGSNNDALVNAAKTGKYQRFVYIGGGSSKADYSTISKPTAAHFNAEEAVVVHDDGLRTIALNTFERVSVLWKTANVVGRLAGLPPQTPITFKRLLIDAEFDGFTSDNDIEAANSDGVLICVKDDELGYVVVELGVNTLQSNDNLVNDDGTTYSIQLSRIKAQLNKELAIYLKKKFFSNQSLGPNRSTVSDEELIAATDTFLKSKHVNGSTDNYLISHQDINVSTNGTVKKVDYKFTPNFEADILVATGTIIDN